MWMLYCSILVYHHKSTKLYRYKLCKSVQFSESTSKGFAVWCFSAQYWYLHLKNSMYVTEQKPVIFTYKLKFILFPQLIATLNNYACSLPPLICFSRIFFADHVYSWLVKWCQLRAPICGDLVWLPLSVHVCLGPVVEYWPFVGTCGYHSTRNSTIYVILLHCLSFCHHSPHPCTPLTHPFIYTGPILWIPWKIVKNWWKSAIIYLPD